MAAAQGWIAIAVLAAAVVASFQLPPLIFGDGLLSLMIGVVLMVIYNGCFLAVVRARSGWRG